jgi:single-stranded-DNA-specific exonuclease
MPRPWRIAPFDEARVRGLAARLNVSPVLAQVLAARGYDSAEQAEKFLDARLNELHDPELLPGVSAAADRIVAAVKAGRRIMIYGDYDVDGVTATSLLWHCLKLAGATVEYYIPHRLEEGYGLNCDALRKFHEDDPSMLVVSVDCGISSTREGALARELSLELIITDHHQFGAELPDAAVLVHPRLPGTNYPFGDLCGAGVAFKLAWAVCARLGDGKKASPAMRAYLMSAVGLAAIGTVADVVPLLDENRVLVRYGLQSLRERASPGLKAMFDATRLTEKPQFSAEDIAFTLAPRINAAGRLGQARLAVELLTTDNPQRAVMLAAYLEEQNKARQTVERRIFKQAKELVEAHNEWDDHKALVLASPEWHAGVIGIVASRVAEHYQKPAVMIAINLEDQTGQGSARSFAGFDLHAGLTQCAAHLQSYGGHQAAAGLRIDAGGIDAFREAFGEYASGHHVVTPADLELQIDAEIRLADLTLRAVNELDRLGPFGRSNPRPVFASSKVELVEPPKKMGEGERHLSLRVRHYGRVLRAVAFGRGEWAEAITAVGGPISISFAPSINRFRGQENVELQLLDWQP